MMRNGLSLFGLPHFSFCSSHLDTLVLSSCISCVCVCVVRTNPHSQVPYSDDPSCQGCMVHHGFYKTFLAVQDQFYQAVLSLKNVRIHACTCAACNSCCIYTCTCMHLASFVLRMQTCMHPISHSRNAMYTYVCTLFTLARTHAQAYPDATVSVTGHSLGAAVATHAALHLHQRNISISLPLYTFGQPRVGNPVRACARLLHVRLFSVQK